MVSNASIVNNYIAKTQMKHGISSWSVPFAKETKKYNVYDPSIYTMDYTGLTISNLMENPLVYKRIIQSTISTSFSQIVYILPSASAYICNMR